MHHRTASIRSMAPQGIDCATVECEVHTGNGIPNVIIVGLPDTAVSEARDRVRSAFVNSGLSFPRKRVTINLAPADVRKSGAHYDVPIALGILQAEGMVRVPEDLVVVGELALDGRVRAVAGALVIADHALQQGMRVLLPQANASELALLHSEHVYLASSLLQVVEALRENNLSSLAQNAHTFVDHEVVDHKTLIAGGTRPESDAVLLEHIIGQDEAKQGMIIAAAGGHNTLLSGPPGVGKTMLARALSQLLPPPTTREILETTKIHSVVRPGVALQTTRPFRQPHHTTSQAAVIGGGMQLHPGELSLAHNGVLFLDELPEFRRDVIEALREPLEKGEVTITRMIGSATYPCRALVIAASNPCPCGFAAPTRATAKGAGAAAGARRCTCTNAALQRYQSKLSGPLVDRFDLKIYVDHVTSAAYAEQRSVQKADVLTTAHAQALVTQARNTQLQRQGTLNACMPHAKRLQYIHIEKSGEALLHAALDKGFISLRGYNKAIGIAATIADVRNAADATVLATQSPTKLQISAADITQALRFTQRQQSQ